ncbi:glycosyltransferase [Halopelagius fulvigenes]|uniref:Glycosyltransferase n=1 Tax=Halopelagius fulvigenes TaxID=1198324 RepID=A0ABD5TZM0_9EURY
MEPVSVAAFTDTYLPTVNGVTYTIETWRDCWRERGGRMDVVFPGSDGYDPDDGEFPVRSVAFPFYDGFRLGVPRVPEAVRDVDLVHAHTPFALGLSGMRLARRREIPFVASYHTPTGEYADYLTSRARVESGIESLSERYERWFFDRADAVVCPSEDACEHLVSEVGVETEVTVLSNGIDVGQFVPTDAADFRRRHDLPDGPLLGYTGRHGYEKNLAEFVRAAEGLDATLVFGGDGPARDHLESLARELDVDARFLGFLPREELPAFYSALDAFVFPSPVETQGLVALEANACGTPVVGVDEGALSDTVVDGVTGYHYVRGDVGDCRDAIRRVLDERESLSESCLSRRDDLSVERAVDELATLYDRVRSKKKAGRR